MLKGPKLLISTYSATSSLQKQGQNVLDRMKNSGWGMGDDSHSNKEDEYESLGRGQHSAQDSGYAEDDTYLGGWNKLKKAVWKEGTPSEAGGSPSMSRTMSNTSHTPSTTNTVTAGAGLYWNKVVASAVAASSVVSTSVSEAVQRARTEDDDFTVGPDGDTKLTRAMKEYHISKASSASDLPTWLFPLSERRRENSYSSSSRQQQEERPSGSNRSHSYQPERESRDNRGERQMRPNHLQHSNTDYDYRSSNNVSISRSSRRGGEEEYGRGGGGGGGGEEERYSEDSSRRRENPRGQVQMVESSGSRATDKLRAMSAAKRVVRSDF